MFLRNLEGLTHWYSYWFQDFFSLPSPFLSDLHFVYFLERALLVPHRHGGKEILQLRNIVRFLSQFVLESGSQCLLDLLSPWGKSGSWQMELVWHFFEQGHLFPKSAIQCVLISYFHGFHRWKATLLLPPSPAWWPSCHLSQLWLLIYCTGCSLPLGCSELQAKILKLKSTNSFKMSLFWFLLYKNHEVIFYLLNQILFLFSDSCLWRELSLTILVFKRNYLM